MSRALEIAEREQLADRIGEAGLNYLELLTRGADREQLQAAEGKMNLTEYQAIQRFLYLVKGGE